MQDQFQITYKGMTAKPEVEAEVRAWLEKLAPLRAAAQMTSGQIAIEAAFGHQRHQQGYRYQVRMQFATAHTSAPMTVGADDVGNVPHDDVYVAIRNGFRSIKRQLLEHAARRAALGEALPVEPSLATADALGPLASVSLDPAEAR